MGRVRRRESEGRGKTHPSRSSVEAVEAQSGSIVECMSWRAMTSR